MKFSCLKHILCVSTASLILALSAQCQALIDYHQHLLMPTGNSSPSFTAPDLIKLLDAAKIHRALVLSMAYRYGNPNNPPVEDEYTRVKAENDWVSRQVALYPDRLRGFCGVDPLKEYALQELERCAKDPYLHYGVKMHFGNSDVDLDNPQHVQQLRQVCQTAGKHKMAIVVHLHSSVTRHRPYGAKEAQIFLDEVLPSAVNIPVQIAHLAGSGGYDDPGVDEALNVFIEAITKQDARMKLIYFDATSVAGLGNWKNKKDLIAQRIRQIGVNRVLFGSDGAFGAGTTPGKAWADFRSLPLSEAEFQIIENNITPYMLTP